MSPQQTVMSVGDMTTVTVSSSQTLLINLRTNIYLFIHCLNIFQLWYFMHNVCERAAIHKELCN